MRCSFGPAFAYGIIAGAVKTMSSALVAPVTNTGSSLAVTTPLNKSVESQSDSDDEDNADTDSMADLWDVDGEMTPEQISAAYAEEKRRKKVKWGVEAPMVERIRFLGRHALARACMRFVQRSLRGRR